MVKRKLSAKKRDYDRMQVENKKFLERLQDSKPTFEAERWVNKRAQEERELKFKCKYPNIFTINNSDSRQSLSPCPSSVVQQIRNSHLGIKTSRVLSDSKY